ncbi:MAG TPA: MFS transporter [Micromonosporaceae bacterium]|jgi:EmrB/QacA subfamily drug resistance transporter
MRRWALALTGVSFFMVTLDALVVITALPAVGRNLGAGISTLEWTVNAYTLTCAAGIITAAALGDRYGRRRLFATGLGLFTAASAACALAPTAGLLIAARAVQGLGAAVIMPLSLTILTKAFPPSSRGAIVGIWGGIAGLGVASGPLIGGTVVQGLDWHWIFWLNVPIGVAATLLARVRLVESYGPDTRLDLPAVAMISLGAVAVIWALVRASDVGLGATLEVLGIGVALIGGFLAWERRAVAPMLPLRLFRSRSFRAANATAFLMTSALFAAAFLTAQYFQLVLGNSPLDTGLRLLPWTATPLLIAPAAGALSDRVGPRPVLATGMALQAVGLGWFGALATVHSGYGRLVLPLLVAGVGVSMALPTTAAAALSAVPPADLGKAAGTANTLQRFGSAFGVAAATSVFAAYGGLGTPASFAAGFRPALTLAAGLSAVGAVTALAVRRRSTVSVAMPAREVVLSAK